MPSTAVFALIQRQPYHAFVPEKQPLVSMVMPSFQKGPYLRPALESLLGQTYPNLEIIVQDNESTDETRQILEAYAPRLTHVAIEKDAGQSDALRRGYARARGEILGWLNADDLLMPDAIRSAVAAMQEEPMADLVYGHCVFLAADGTFQGYYHDIQPVTAELLGNSGSFICQPGAFFRREAYERIGGVNLDLHFTMDWDLWCRFARGGGPLRMVDQVWAGARVYPETKSSGGGWKRFREILRTNRRYKTTFFPRAVLAYLYGAKIRPHFSWLNRPMGALWRSWTRSSVDAAVIEGFASGRRPVRPEASLRFPLFRNLQQLKLGIAGHLKSAMLGGEEGRILEEHGDCTVTWEWPAGRFIAAVDLRLEFDLCTSANAKIAHMELSFAPDAALPRPSDVVGAGSTGDHSSTSLEDRLESDRTRGG
jgi:glycosyltransferase involved in cell wall biosynthesis